MLQTDEDFPFKVPQIDSASREQRINTSSTIQFLLMSRNGDLIFESIVNVEGSNQMVRNQRATSQYEYIQDIYGNYNLPLLGKVNLNGMTLFEAQDSL
jgi:hypothetical protein